MPAGRGRIKTLPVVSGRQALLTPHTLSRLRPFTSFGRPKCSSPSLLCRCSLWLSASTVEELPLPRRPLLRPQLPPRLAAHRRVKCSCVLKHFSRRASLRLLHTGSSRLQRRSDVQPIEHPGTSGHAGHVCLRVSVLQCAYRNLIANFS